jgi:hypothetical protein
MTLLVSSHDNVATVLRQHGAVLVFPGKQAGVLMCQVRSPLDFAKKIHLFL